MTEDKSQSMPKSDVAQKEEEILKFWQDNKIFEKSLEKPSPNGNYVFYDGPPFATGLPHYGHIVPGTIKDVIPRYKTMQGYKVTRRWGWDTQGVPIEALVQKENDLKTKKDIEEFGIGNFNDFARKTVFRFADQWEEIIPRTGRWVDFKDLYTTMSPDYTQSIWWMWKTLYEKGLVYEGFKSMHVSPPLETALSNFEVNQGYKDVTDISVTAKFELVDEKGTFVLAWTTTPWTLPGNTALAINENLQYVKVNSENQNFIVSKDLAEKVFTGKEFKVIDEFEGKTLIGKSYNPVFDYYSKDTELKNFKNGWKIYHGDFVTTVDGTGIVHIAPAFGEDDLVLSQAKDIPFVQHVSMDGFIKPAVTDFKGLQAKPKDDPTSTDIEIIKNLAHRGLLFAKEKFTHSYPHCYRTDAPLLNYAMSSWFINVTKEKNKLISENEKVNWVPDFAGSNRFGNWLKDAKDWSVSRSRYWGTPIPVWKSEDEKEVVVIGSLDELKDKTKSTNKYFVMRHAEAEHNVNNILSCDDSVPSKLTEKGIEDAKDRALKLKGEKIDLIIASPLMRTVQTAKIIAEHVGIDEKDILIDDRLKETQAGVFNGKPIEEYRSFYKNNEEKFVRTSEGGETLTDMKNRLGDFIYDIDKKYEGKNILVVTHEYSVWLLQSAISGLDVKQSVALRSNREDFVLPADFKEISFSRIPLNKNYELDFHRPFIDDITFVQDGKKMKRIPDVFDTWIDSGSVPYASFNYPVEKDRFKENFPADFISEGLDQTRGWFYAMLVLNTMLFGKAPYKNVVVNGLLLAEDGRKMSKRLKNYPEVDVVLNKYGADALRYFLMASPVVRAESMAFSEKGVDDVMKKIILRLNNVVTFYELYADDAVALSDQSENVLDKWMIARLNQLHAEVTESMESYELDRATRPFMDFIDDLSTWYLRRSRDRFKGEEKKEALETTRFVLHRLAILLAPFTPFIAEDVYKKVRGEKESVHLESWPKVKKEGRGLFGMFGKKENEVDPLIAQMQTLRDVVTRVLEARSKVGIRVRQPLQSLKIKGEYSSELLDLIKEEVNVKEIFSDKDLKEEIELDTEITSELKEEGYSREIIRFIQSLRKDAKLDPNDSVVLYVSANDYTKSIFDKFEEEIMETTRVSSIYYNNESGSELSMDELSVKMRIEEK